MTRCEAENAEARDTSMLHLTGFKSESRLESLDIIARSTTSVIEIWRLPQNFHPHNRSREVSRPLAVVIVQRNQVAPLLPNCLLKRFLYSRNKRIVDVLPPKSGGAPETRTLIYNAL